MNLLHAAAEITRFLDTHNVPHFIIGGLALQHWGEPRMTRDIDIIVLVASEQLASFVDAVLERFNARSPDTRAFALQHRVVLIQTDQGVPIDISLGIPGYEEEALKRAVQVNFPEVGMLRLIGPEDMIIHKCVAGRPRDLEDVMGILIQNRLNLRFDTIRNWLEELSEVVDSHNPLELFKQTLNRAQKYIEREG